MGTFKLVAACSDSPFQPPLARTMGSLNTPPTTAAPVFVDFLPEELEAGPIVVVVVVVGAGAFWTKATPWIGVMRPRSGDDGGTVDDGGREPGFVVGGVFAMVVGTVVVATVVVVVGGGHLCFLQAGLVVVVVGIVVVVRSGRVMIESVIGEPTAGKLASAAAGLMAWTNTARVAATMSRPAILDERRSGRHPCGDLDSTAPTIGAKSRILELRRASVSASPRGASDFLAPLQHWQGCRGAGNVAVRATAARTGHNGSMVAAGLLLTGGSSRRMGVDKALLEIGGVRLADRTADILLSATEPTIEVGPGYTVLRSTNDPSPGLGPLAALAHGVAALQAIGWVGPAIVVATDLPLLSGGLLAWLAGHPSPRSIVPLDCSRPQPLCARYQAADLETAQSLVRAGKRSMKELLAAIDPLFVGSDEWSGPAGHPLALADVDSPADLEQFGWASR